MINHTCITHHSKYTCTGSSRHSGQLQRHAEQTARQPPLGLSALLAGFRCGVVHMLFIPLTNLKASHIRWHCQVSLDQENKKSPLSFVWISVIPVFLCSRSPSTHNLAKALSRGQITDSQRGKESQLFMLIR